MLATELTAIAGAYLFASLIALAQSKPGYNHVEHSISEIGEVGATNQRFVAFGLFLPVGSVLLLVACLVRAASPVAATLALCIAVGYIGAAALPCDPGSPLFGTARQGLHNLAGAVEYVGGGFALLKLAEGFGQPFEAAGFFVLGTAIALSILPLHAVRGIFQRIAECCLFDGLALAVWMSRAAV